MFPSSFSSAPALEVRSVNTGVEGEAFAPFTNTPWQVPYDYGTVFYCTGGRAEAQIGLHHHMLGVELTPGIVRTRHNSARWSSEIMVSGALYFVAAGSTIDVRKEHPIDFILATIDPESADRIFREAGVSGGVPSFAVNLVDPIVDRQARQLRQMFLRRDRDVSLFASGFVQRAVSRVMRYDHARHRSGRYQLAPHQIRSALEFINENLSSSLSIETLAQESTGLSGFYFAHAFTAMLGHSPHQYILERRLSRAHELIASTTSSLAEISYSVGFSSQAHMTSTFGRRLGITPGRLRQPFA
ncbi:AraC family transcriptional regulator [Burkholderia sp. L27(2015)]|uniref:AraC family transcriptional regulator n=1 Tax=Burkholderia sp. L27(2015) TaxID=1641858 RepID=UPI001C20C277|nr:AraC family transcriptional regulator [Burkholderia sp. L27(2015)]